MLAWDTDGRIDREVRKRLQERKIREEAEKLERERQDRIAAGYPADLIPPKKPQYDSPYAMENSTATFLYIATMIIGTLFQDRILVYVAATIIWWKYITRHKEK
jgi:hypothetical protein